MTESSVTDSLEDDRSSRAEGPSGSETARSRTTSQTPSVVIQQRRNSHRHVSSESASLSLDSDLIDGRLFGEMERRSHDESDRRSLDESSNNNRLEYGDSDVQLSLTSSSHSDETGDVGVYPTDEDEPYHRCSERSHSPHSHEYNSHSQRREDTGSGSTTSTTPIIDLTDDVSPAPPRYTPLPRRYTSSPILLDTPENQTQTQPNLRRRVSGLSIISIADQEHGTEDNGSDYEFWRGRAGGMGGGSAGGGTGSIASWMDSIDYGFEDDEDDEPLRRRARSDRSAIPPRAVSAVVDLTLDDDDDEALAGPSHGSSGRHRRGYGGGGSSSSAAGRDGSSSSAEIDRDDDVQVVGTRPGIRLPGMREILADAP
ncbi:hypothetical protein HK104_005160, partial [Borealophlyctis nickersoniae]